MFSKKSCNGNLSLQIRYDSYIGIFRPFGTISEVFEKVPRNVPRKVPSFRVFQNPVSTLVGFDDVSVVATSRARFARIINVLGKLHELNLRMV